MSAITIDDRPTMLEDPEHRREFRQREVPGGAQVVRVLNVLGWSSAQIAAAKTLFRLQALPTNWDSYQSRPPTSASIQTAITFIRMVPFPAALPLRIVPIAGGIQFEWDNGARELEVEFCGDGSSRFLGFCDEEVIFEEKSMDITESQINALISWLIAG